MPRRARSVGGSEATAPRGETINMNRLKRRPGCRRPFEERWQMITSGTLAQPRLRRACFSGWSSSCGISSRCAIAAWPGTWLGRRPCSPWLIFTECGIRCSWGEVRAVNRIDHTMRAADHPRAAKTRVRRVFPLSNLIIVSNRCCITTCAECPSASVPEPFNLHSGSTIPQPRA